MEDHRVVILVVVVIHSVYHWTPNSLHQLAGIRDTEHSCMELNIKVILTVTVIFMDVITLKYHVQFIMSVIVLQSTWFLLTTHAPQDGPESIMVT